MFDGKRARYFGIRRRVHNEEVIARLQAMTREEQVRWADEQLRRAPASEMERLLWMTLYSDPRVAAA